MPPKCQTAIAERTEYRQHFGMAVRAVPPMQTQVATNATVRAESQCAGRPNQANRKAAAAKSQARERLERIEIAEPAVRHPAATRIKRSVLIEPGPEFVMRPITIAKAQSITPVRLTR